MSAAAAKKFRNSARSIPMWEKSTRRKMGGPTWKRKEKAKNYIHDLHDVVRWNDSAAAGKKFQNRARSVPTWEKRFYSEKCGLPWKRIKTAMKHIHGLPDVVVRWDDSAGQEALYDAKRRYWMTINGQPCNIPLPSPDMCIDEVDWSPNNNVGGDENSELLEDLNAAASPCEAEEEEIAFINSIDVSFDQIKPTGWDVDDDNAAD